jgi:serine/threonine-protein phosphatase 2B catalytic subunit
MDSFDLIPLACIVNGKFIALHGGISPELKSVKIKRTPKKFNKQFILC